MNIRSRQELKNAARLSLSQSAYSPKKLALLHAAVTAIVSLTFMALNYLLSQQAIHTGGLSGMGARAILSTAQSVMNMAFVLVLPFWEQGLVYAFWRISRQEEAGPHSLLEGLRKFLPLLRLYLLQCLIYLGIFLLATQISSVILMFTPYYDTLMETFDALAVSEIPDDAMLMAAMEVLLPLYLLIAGFSLILLTPILYRYRLANYALLEGRTPRALLAMGISSAVMKGNRFALFRLDLSFWWYYGIMIALSVIDFGDSLLVMLGLPLPLGETGTSFLFYGLYLLGFLLLTWFATAYVQTTYGCAYDALMTQAEEAAKPTPIQLPAIASPEDN